MHALISLCESLWQMPPASVIASRFSSWSARAYRAPAAASCACSAPLSPVCYSWVRV